MQGYILHTNTKLHTKERKKEKEKSKKVHKTTTTTKVLQKFREMIIHTI